MKKVRLFPFWTDLERVTGIMKSQVVSDIKLTLVSIENYTHSGFLLTMNVETIAPNNLFNRNGIGSMRAVIIDQKNNRHTSMIAMIPGVFYKNMFSGRAVLICMPQLSAQAQNLTITIDSIEWEYTDEAQPPSVVITGPWEFTIFL